MRALIIFLGLALLQIYQVTAFTHTLSVFMQCRCKTLTLTTMEQHEQDVTLISNNLPATTPATPGLPAMIRG